MVQRLARRKQQLAADDLLAGANVDLVRDPIERGESKGWLLEDVVADDLDRADDWSGRFLLARGRRRAYQG